MCDQTLESTRKLRAEDQHAPGRAIAFFGYDSAESTVIKRVKALQGQGWRVVGFMFRRVRGMSAPQPAWENVELGVTIDRHYGDRLPKLLKGLMTVLKHKQVLRECKVYYARNIDMLLIAVLAAVIARTRPVLVYEVLDVQRIFVGARARNIFMRWVERVLLRFCDLVVVSSPDFITSYFTPYQKLAVPWRLLENKVSADQLPACGFKQASPRLDCPPWVIGWFGTLRCTKSLEILCRIADELGDKVQIYLRGRLSEEDLSMSAIDAACARHPNVVFEGSYRSPDDLPMIYGRVHFSWAVDYLDAGTNSDWLLPNRVYEGGLFGSLALTRRDTATARKVERDGLGWAFEGPLERSVAEFLDGLDAGTYERARDAVRAMPRSMFVDETETRDLLAYLDTAVRQRGA